MLQRYTWSRVCWTSSLFNEEFVLASDAEELELAVERATSNMVAAQNRCAELEELNERLKRELGKAFHIISKGIA